MPADYSDPLDEQTFMVHTINGWKSVWHKQQKPVAATTPYVPPVNPMLANHPNF